MKFCSLCFPQFHSVYGFGVAAGRNLEHFDCLTKGTHLFFYIVRWTYTLFSSHGREHLLTKTLSGSQSYKITIRTYLTHFVCGVCTESIHTVSQKYKATEPWVSEMFLSPQWSVVYPSLPHVFICKITTTCVAAELPPLCLHEICHHQTVAKRSTGEISQSSGSSGV